MRRASYGARDGSWGRRRRPSAPIGRRGRPRLRWRFSRAWVREGGGGWGRFSGCGGRIRLIPFDPESPLTLSCRWYRRSAAVGASALVIATRLMGSIARPASTAGPAAHNASPAPLFARARSGHKPQLTIEICPKCNTCLVLPSAVLSLRRARLHLQRRTRGHHSAGRTHTTFLTSHFDAMSF